VADEQVIKLLEEIRDLQKGYNENYKAALKNQQEAIDLQKRAFRRQSGALMVVGLFLLGIFLLAMSAHR
jgi:hypothetical protein